ncbi:MULTISPECIES: hypothetical protein [Enterococcus]|uniref:hypothetical protein n=1 Tax=Enterococcus TaxID=1350 RepID=UPI0009C0DFD1|nr:hypothetical protein [Enterococcus gallinarum]OQO76589.1 hypothetical protein BH745_16090 [Enterococcus gallinarum]
MKVIALKGHVNSGKTSTLLNINNLLENDLNYSVSIAKQKIENKKDFLVKFTNNDTKNEIAIYSEGDSPESVNQAIKKFNNLKTNDILVLACRTKGKVLKILEPYNPIYIRKSTTYYDETTQDYVNESDAKIIHGKVKQLDI